ncbi:MAG: MBL fold metallo-hydrolase [Chitinophagaceae bacterium]|nr:MBL fold metallo-hydrolase [Chitinophagaceae bacterium]
MIHVKVFTFNAVQENTYLLYNDDRKAIIIDPGCYTSAEQETLKNFLKDTGLEAVKLLNTHCHLDHVFGNDWVHSSFGLELHLHPDEEKVLEFAPRSGETWGLPFINYSGPLHFLREGDEVILGEDRLKVLLTPGHSPGSICFYNEKQGFVIGGDVLFYQSIGRTDIPYGNSETLLNSIRTKLYTLPDEVTVYPGHGRPTSIGHEKKFNPYIN